MPTRRRAPLAGLAAACLLAARLLAACLLAACAGERRDGPGGSDVPAWTVDPAPLLTIGGETDDPASALERVGDVLRLRDGRIVVVNGSAELRFHTADGRLAVTQGRQGRGPGEYRGIYGIARLPGDSVAVFDGLAGRLSIVDPQGRFARAVRIPPPGARLVGALADGSVVVGPRARQWVPAGGETETSEFLYYRVPSGGDSAVTLAAVPGSRHFVVRFPDGGQGQRDLPFAAAPSAAVGDSLFFVTAGADYVIHVHTPDGRRVRTITLPRSPVPVTDADLARYRADRLAELASSPREQRLFETIFARMPKPEHFPAIGDLIVDDDGWLWVQDYPRTSDGPQSWTVLDATGAVLATATTPPGLHVRRIGRDYVLGVARDTLDLERVVLHALRR
ncbi:MAG TPA: hypothetical protein VFS08_03605 [Gemmatimonadaceae bacterium]|nr:hypothetical protein [Gemmatimonadaceae bacterium]